MAISPLETEENAPVPDIEPGKRYMVVEYAPLVVASRPQAYIPANDGINFKRFKKVIRIKTRQHKINMQIIGQTIPRSRIT
jgi:hypothetical protein